MWNNPCRSVTTSINDKDSKLQAVVDNRGLGGIKHWAHIILLKLVSSTKFIYRFEPLLNQFENWNSAASCLDVFSHLVSQVPNFNFVCLNLDQ